MTSKACKHICLLNFFAFVTQGYGCDRDRSKTEKMVTNKPEWEVKVTDPCSCEFLEIMLSCVGFKSVTTIDSSVLSKTGDMCLLNNGKYIGYGDYVFKYVWDTSFDRKITDARIVCS